MFPILYKTGLAKRLAETIQKDDAGTTKLVHPPWTG